MEQENQTPIDKAPSPTAPSNPPIHKKISALLFLEIGIAEVLFVLFGLILIFGTLNYFNVFKISSSIPFLSFLPTKNPTSENMTASNLFSSKIDPDVYKPMITACPIEDTVCIKGQELHGNESTTAASFRGLGFTVDPQTKIYSTIDGDLEFSNKTVTITNNSREIKVNYEFSPGSFSAGSSSAKIKINELIGTIINETRIKAFGEKYNLLLSIESINPPSFMKIKVDPNRMIIIDNSDQSR